MLLLDVLLSDAVIKAATKVAELQQLHVLEQRQTELHFLLK